MMTSSPRTNVLITGGTGFVGKAVIARLVDQPRYGKIYLLVRGKRGQTADERVAEIVRRMFPRGRQDVLQEKIRAVPGDLTEPGCGLSDELIDGLKNEIHQILHVGASTEFGAPLEEARLNNLEGTRHVLDVAMKMKARGVLERFDYVSTAYVCGRKPGLLNEDSLVRGQDFSNTYEQSKYEAEILVKEYASRLPTAIYRPSIIVGDSNSGYTPHFKVLYWPLLLLSKNLLPFFACNQRAYLDVVPVDFVADGIVALMQRASSVGETFHLTAGLGNEIRICDLLRDSYQLAGIQRRPILPLWLFNLIWHTPLKKYYPEHFWDAVEIARPYFPYLHGNDVRFDASKTLSILKSLGIEPPSWDDYKREVLGFCLTSRWGKKLPMPEYIYYLPVSSRKEAGREFANRNSGKISGTFGIPVGQNA
jgi:thioester reductase-like protein